MLCVLALALSGLAAAAVPAVEATRVDGHGFTLGWSALPQDIDEARVEILGPKGGKTFSVLATVPKSARGYFLQRVSYSGKYKFRLSLVRNGVVEIGPVSSYSTMKVKGPDAWAGGLIEMSAFATHVDLKWTEIATNEAGIKIYRRDEFSETQPVEILLPKDTKFYRDTIPLPGKRYYYSVATVDKKGRGWPGMELEVNVPLPGDPPTSMQAPPTTLTQQGANVLVRITPIFGGNAEGYSVQRQFSQGWSYWIEVGRTGRFDSSFVDTLPGASASRPYRLVPFNSNGVADPYRGTWDFPPYPRGHSLWQAPVLADGVIHLLAADGKKIHRFDAATNAWLAPVVPKIPGPIRRFTVGGANLFVQSREELYRVTPATGDVDLLGSGYGPQGLVAENNFLIYQGQSFVTIELAPDGKAQQAVRSFESQMGDVRPIGTAFGRHLVFGDWQGINSGPAVRSVEFFGQSTQLVASSTSRVPGDPDQIFPVSDGKMLLSDQGWITVEGDSTSGPIATVTGAGVLDAVSLPGYFNAVLHQGEIQIYDRWWNEIQSIAVPTDAIALRWSNDRLWAIASDATAEGGWRVDGHEPTLLSSDAAFWTSPVAPEGLESTADGGQILVHRASGTWRRRAAGAAAFGPPQEAGQGIIDWKFDRAGDALAILWGAGQVTRQTFSGVPGGTWHAAIRRDAAFMVEVGGKLEFSNNQTLGPDGQSSGPAGYWQFRPKFTAWDGVKKYLYFQWFEDLIVLNRTGDPYHSTPSMTYINEETLSHFLRFSDDRTQAVFGGGLICSYPGLVTTRQLPLDARDAEWTADGLFAVGKNAAQQSMLGSFDRDGKTRASAVLPGEATQLARDGADGWMVLCHLPDGGWQLLRTDAALSAFEKLAGADAPLPVSGAVLPNATMRFPDWYEDQMHIGDPDGNGLTAVQEYMMARYPEWKTLPPVGIDRSGAVPRFQIRRRPDSELAPFRVAIEYSADLQTWTETIPAQFNVLLQDFGGYQIIWVEPKAEATGGYFRVRFVGPAFDE